MYPLGQTRSTALPPSIIGGLHALPAEARHQLLQLRKPTPLRFVGEIAKTWIIIALVIGASVHVNNLYITILSIIIIAGRQNVLGLLMHEQTHYNGIKNAWGDVITDLFVCYPLIVVSVLGYARVHLAHHAFFLSDRDPDLIRKSGSDWAFPMKWKQFLFLLAKDLCGLTLIQNILGKNRMIQLQQNRLGPNHSWLRFIYLGSISLILIYTSTWSIFLLYWCLPMVTVFQAMIRIAAVCEHVYIKDGALEITTPTIIPRKWETFVLPHLNFFHHVYHHYCPGIPWWRLPEAHIIFIRAGLVREERVFVSYLSYFKSLFAR
jgi:fatty acid desaturase